MPDRPYEWNYQKPTLMYIRSIVIPCYIWDYAFVEIRDESTFRNAALPPPPPLRVRACYRCRSPGQHPVPTVLPSCCKHDGCGLDSSDLAPAPPPPPPRPALALPVPAPPSRLPRRARPQQRRPRREPAAASPACPPRRPIQKRAPHHHRSPSSSKEAAVSTQEKPEKKSEEERSVFTLTKTEGSTYGGRDIYSDCEEFFHGKYTRFSGFFMEKRGNFPWVILSLFSVLSTPTTASWKFAWSFPVRRPCHSWAGGLSASAWKTRHLAPSRVSRTHALRWSKCVVGRQFHTSTVKLSRNNPSISNLLFSPSNSNWAGQMSGPKRRGPAARERRCMCWAKKLGSDRSVAVRIHRWTLGLKCIGCCCTTKQTMSDQSLFHSSTSRKLMCLV